MLVAFYLSLLAVPWAALQGLATALVADDHLRRACDIAHGDAYYTWPAIPALVAALLAPILTWRFPRVAVALAAGSVALSLLWVLRGGWGDFNCALGV